MKSRRNTKHTIKRRNVKRTHRRDKKGGFGGWNRITTVGPNWNGHNNGNHFSFNPNGAVVGGIDPAVPEMWGPKIGQANVLHPPLGQKALSMSGGHKRRQRRSMRGGVDIGGFPSMIKTGWDNAKIGVTNVYRGFMGFDQAQTASPWVQPAFDSHKMPTPQLPKPYVMNALKNMS
jgi:hypothetical protein